MTHLFIVTFVVFLLFIVAMAIGVFFGKKPIKGSCGGLNKITGEDCAFCDNKKKCTRNKKNTKDTKL